MRSRLDIAGLVSLALVLPACGQSADPPPRSPDAVFAESLRSLNVPIDGTDPEAIHAAKDTCQALTDGQPIAEIYALMEETIGFDEDQARGFTAASIYAYCPGAVT